MRTLFIDIQRPLSSRLLDPPYSKQDMGSGTPSISRKLDKPLREFNVKSWDQLLRDQAEIIRNELLGGRITLVAWFDGDQWGDITEPIFIADADGYQTDYPMPFYNCYASSWKIWVNQTLNTDWTMTGDTLSFGSAPSGRITGLGKRKFRVIMADNSGSILNESQTYSYNDDGVYELDAFTLQEVNATSVA